jgi:hypothetical protein
MGENVGCKSHLTEWSLQPIISPQPTNQEWLSVAVSRLSARRSIIRSTRETRLRKNIRNPLAPTDFESRDSSGHGASPFEFRWMAPPINITNMTTAATGNAGRSAFTGDEERTFENCVEEAWKLDVYSSSEAETSTMGTRRATEMLKSWHQRCPVSCRPQGLSRSSVVPGGDQGEL